MITQRDFLASKNWTHESPNKFQKIVRQNGNSDKTSPILYIILAQESFAGNYKFEGFFNGAKKNHWKVVYSSSENDTLQTVQKFFINQYHLMGAVASEF